MITLKKYQETARDNVLGIFRYVRNQLSQVSKPEEKASIISHNGGVLLNAPTGSGKTLIAGEIAQSLCLDEGAPVVWFWFTPFKGLVGQAESSLRDKFPSLRIRNLKNDRKAIGTESGDLWVTTWQAVATRDKDARKIRNDSEENLSIDALLLRLRQMGCLIGVIVDEAHHGFGHGTQALDFYTQHLQPDFTLLLTATPDDSDAASFKRATGFQRLHQVIISREDAVAEGLIKPDVRSIAFIAEPDQEAIVDFETTALREGTRMHRQIKSSLQATGIDLVPLMLVQVDSSANSINRVKEKLAAEGFSDNQIAVHTAEEPDPNLLAIAVDETKEVLIFKMSVALGFDAPRAFTLVSMRGIVDKDFGTQIVGRIMRVHRLCQGRDLPPLLQNAYVFLADCEAQSGLSTAAQKLNNLKTELAQVSPYTVVVQVAGQNQLQIVRNGQPYLLPSHQHLPAGITTSSADPLAPNQVQLPKAIELFELLQDELGDNRSNRSTKTISGGYNYLLKKGMPTVFLTQRMMVGVDEEGMAGGIAKNLDLTDAILDDGMIRAISVKKVDQAVFAGDEAKRERIVAEMMGLQETEILSEKMLFSMGTVNPRELREQLLERLRSEYQRRGLTIADDDEQLNFALDLILVQHPKLLRNARKACEAAYTEVVQASPIPDKVWSSDPLTGSPKNIYGIYPGDLNTWERPFAEWLDNTEDGFVLWWHRNLPHKAWSVAVTLSNGSQFFPDFLVGIENRLTPDSVLMIDTKRAINDDSNSLVKAVCSHKEYGKTVILFYEDEKRWKVVRYNEEKDKNELAEQFDIRNASAF